MLPSLINHNWYDILLCRYICSGSLLLGSQCLAGGLINHNWYDILRCRYICSGSLLLGSQCLAGGTIKHNAQVPQLVAGTDDGFMFARDRTPWPEAVDEKHVNYEVFPHSRPPRYYVGLPSLISNILCAESNVRYTRDIHIRETMHSKLNYNPEYFFCTSYITYVMLIWAPLIPDTRWGCSPQSLLLAGVNCNIFWVVVSG